MVVVVEVGMVVEMEQFLWMTSDQLEEPEISEEEKEEEICPKGTLRGGSMCWAPAWGEVRDINHTSQLPVSALSSVPSQKPSSPARGVSVEMGEGPRSWKPAVGNGNLLGMSIWSHQSHEMGSGRGLVGQGAWRS